MSKVRLVAYRKALDTSTEDTAYELDMQKAPNITLNFQFADIKEPEKRKANYSQTFKLPFTKKNNAFFQNWFNVNLDTLVFDTRTRFFATIYVGTIPQFEGVIQLRSVYQKAQLYEVVVKSSAADLFTNVGNRKLRDVFLQDDGTYSYELNHLFTADNIEKSWDGTATDFYSRTSSATQGPSLKDPDHDIQKVMYPISVTKERFWYNTGSNSYLRLSQATIDTYPAMSIFNDFIFLPWITASLTQLRPAVQIKTLFKLIIAKAGFSYTSAFLDGAYFSKLFMTTGNKSSIPAPIVIQTPGTETGNAVVGEESLSEMYEWSGNAGGGGSQDIAPLYNLEFTADRNSPDVGYSEPNDPTGFWNIYDNYFIRTDPAMTSITLRWRSYFENFEEQFIFAFILKLQPLNYTTLNPSGDAITAGSGITFGMTEATGGNTVGVIDLKDVPLGTKFKILIDVPVYESMRDSNLLDAKFRLFACKVSTGNCNFPGNYDLALQGYDNMYNKLSINWEGYNENIYDQVVDIPGNIDDSITQKAFLKDIVERFNLVILPDPNDQTNLLIEPYDTFIASGGIKHWTDKLDLNKEIVVKDTVSMQKKTIELSDKPDIDLMNKAIADNAPSYNVWGKHEFVTDNDYSSGVMKNNPIFAPFITQMVFEGPDTAAGTNVNMPVHYEFTYEIDTENETGYANVLKPTKSKIFFYSGTPTNFESDDDINKWYLQYYLIAYQSTIDNSVVGGYSDYVKSKEFTTFPKCSSYELNAEDNLNTSSRSLLWGDVPPVNQGLYNWAAGAMSQNSLYHYYWKNYFNSIYNPDARLMECHLNLNEVDITNFNFSDEIFIKDSYWRVLKISNYQVGAKASCKATLLKVLDNFDTTCPDCGQVVGETAEGQNAFDGLFLWCPETDPDCVPTLDDQYLLTSEACCNCNGGNWFSNAVNASGLSHCQAFAGSLPAYLASANYPLSIYEERGLKTIIAGKVSGNQIPFVRGSNTNKYSRPLMKYIPDDIVIKYTNNTSGAGMVAPIINGESHRMVLMGNTDKNTRGYAYPQGSSGLGDGTKLTIPLNSNMLIKVKGTATVIGGTSSTYPLGNIEGFAYYTAFKRIGSTITQLGTVGGTPEFALKEGGLAATCTLYIDSDASTFELKFGLDDSQTDTQRVWQLSVELDVNAVSNMELALNNNFALWQDSTQIQLQNYSLLIWN